MLANVGGTDGGDALALVFACARYGEACWGAAAAGGPGTGALCRCDRELERVWCACEGVYCSAVAAAAAAPRVLAEPEVLRWCERVEGCVGVGTGVGVGAGAGAGAGVGTGVGVDVEAGETVWVSVREPEPEARLSVSLCGAGGWYSWMLSVSPVVGGGRTI
jgi:hypothetical protein